MTPAERRERALADQAAKAAAKEAAAKAEADKAAARQSLQIVKAATRQQKALEARDNFITFMKFTSPDPEDPDDVSKSRYKDAKHHRVIGAALEECAKGNPDYRQLIVCLPPRHGKSEMTTRKFPAWVAGKFSSESVGVATYSDVFAADFGAEVRTVIQSPQYKQVFPGMALRRGGTATDRLQTVDGGLLFFVGRGGSMTGRGCHTLIIDDLIKDDKEASSQAIRDQAWNWMTRVAMTRRMGKKRVILIMTRWHADDPVGRLTDPENPCYNEDEAKSWKIINLPAIAEDEDPLGRKPGEALWPDGPDQFDLDFLNSQRRMDPMGFSALYQQRPSAIDGVAFQRENIKTYTREQLPPDLRIYSASDHALSLNERRDYTVLLTVGVDRDGDLWLLDCIWRRMKPDVVVENMLEMVRAKPPLIWYAGRDHITKSIGPFLKKRMQETQTYFTLREVTPVGDKEARAQAIAARVAMGRVHFPRDAVWTERAINEMLAFPNGTHDDFVDTIALIGLGMQSQHAASGPKKSLPGLPKFGTVSWIKWADKAQKQQQLEDSRGGF